MGLASVLVTETTVICCDIETTDLSSFDQAISGQAGLSRRRRRSEEARVTPARVRVAVVQDATCKQK